ncbi:hypothetical protein [Paenibacillus sp. Soil750]|uniref:hypothetical protein n=1 Tax=Paenibacillus sp. Soil750 TaxID=1736398 RepID=UPI0006F26EE4|nr:hypothetical protein [Paenibacillus sp. Soil750]KRE57455.1 hypothetical protein ASL11_31565 [Paenibacillus sp. Soil750]
MKKILITIFAIGILLSPIFISRQNAISNLKRNSSSCTIEKVTVIWFQLSPHWKITCSYANNSKHDVVLDIFGNFEAG